MTVYAFDPERHTNARAIAQLAELPNGLRRSDRILDLTVGPERGFWSEWQPDEKIVTNDINRLVPADFHFDATAAPLPDRSFDVVAGDAPYKYEGRRHKSGARYGLTGAYLSPQAVDARLLAITREALRIADRLALIKCQSQNVASRYRQQAGFVCDLARQLGARVAQELYVVEPRPQPDGKRQLNVWGYPSVLLVLEPQRRRSRKSK